MFLKKYCLYILTVINVTLMLTPPAFTGHCMSASDLQEFLATPSLLTHEGNKNILIMNIYSVSQKYISEVLRQYPRLRDLHHEPPFHAILVHMSRWIALGLNATLLSFGNLTLCPEISADLQQLPTLLGPIVSNSLLKTYQIHKQKNLPKLRFGLTFPMLLNFAYCDDISVGGTITHNVSLLETLFGEVDNSVWICLGVSLIFVSLHANFAVIRKNGKVYIIRSKHATVMTTLSILISNGASGRIKKKSVLFVLWMYGCLVFVTHYACEMTSDVISPPTELRMSRVDQLVENKYSLIFDRQNFPIHLTKAAIEFAQTSSTNNEAFLNMNVMKMVSEARTIPAEEEFWREMATGGKYAVYVRWPAAIFAANRGNKFILENGIQERRCFIGKELKYLINNHYGFAGKHNEKLAKVASAMEEYGFYVLWWKEFFGLATSRRVQSRSRMVNPTRLQEDKDQVKALDLDGKLLQVFFLWIIGLVLSFASFIVEKYWKSSEEISNFFYKKIIRFSTD